MRSAKHIKLIIGVDGQCSIDAINFTDSSCQKATHEIAVALGGQIDTYSRHRPQRGWWLIAHRMEKSQINSVDLNRLYEPTRVLGVNRPLFRGSMQLQNQ